MEMTSGSAGTTVGVSDVFLFFFRGVVDFFEDVDFLGETDSFGKLDSTTILMDAIGFSSRVILPWRLDSI